MTNAVGTDKTTVCLSCRSPNTLGARFCNSCGTTLTKLDSASDFTLELPDGSNAAPDLLRGRIIESKYRIENLIGIGGMGAVYRATRLLIGDEVAIKILQTEKIFDAHAAQRFQREARAAARLKHPNAVSIYDFGVSSDGLQYLVMELIEGRSLRDVLKQQGPLEPLIATEVTSQVCAALDEAHRQHIVHRDIKPDNIIINSSGSSLRAKVLDFGIAKLRDDTASHLTQTGSVMGTPHYMSPEQCLGEELDQRADIYSMGVVLYEMLCGRVPFNSPISTAVIVQHVNQPPPPLRTINAAISPQLEAVVLHALEKTREARPQSAHELARSVEAAVSRSSPAYNDLLTKPVSAFEASADDERTIEKRLPAGRFEASKSSKEMMPTVNLSHPSGSTNQVAPAGVTAKTGMTSGLLRQAAMHKSALAALALVVIAAMIGLIWWGSSKDRTSNTNSSTNSKPESPSTVTPNVNKNRTREDPVPPPGMTYVAGGAFNMGSNTGDQDSKPQHAVTVRPFFIDVNEVTREDYKKMIDETGRPAPAGWVNGNYPPGTARHPVTGVSWADADVYARWAGKRLPTEDEWEFAARGSQGFTYPWGNAWKPGCANADQEGKARQEMADVGSYKCDTLFKTADMIGNAWEWTSSDWAPYPHGTLQHPSQGGEKVIRGGSWESSREYASGVFRSGFAGPGDKTGFRCAQSAQP
jgi:eukaryotic-like serine/threonine-protein kinase